ncbi:MAG: GvpL/GvpF family gas vesicle protein [bacterium]|nr:GvpL/GvpF family gas vesicle protein [bacterium]
MIKEGKYIYSIIQDSNPPATLPSASPMGPYENRSFGFVGINNREVNLVHYKDITAVVSNTPVINFDRLDKKELTKHIATHQKVNEELMKDYDLVPMTFGIIAPSSDEVLRILEKAYLQFKTALKNTAGKAEFAVQVCWDPKKLLEELISTNLEIQKLKQKVALKGSIFGMPTKLKLGKLIQKEAEIRRQAFINDIHASLRNLSFDSTSNKLIDDEMIANFSFLMEKVKEPELDKKMQELGKKYEGKLRFKYIGPMPPYSFVNINLSLGNFELVDEARKLLGLAEEVSFDEIKKAYYFLSHQYHPDKFQGNEEQMKKIAQAYRLLENYCESCDALLGQKSQKYSFKKENVENSLIIK